MPYPRIKELREKSGFTQSEMSKLLKMPITTYRSYETGTREPNLEVLVQLSEMYKVSVDYILSHTPKEPKFSQEETMHIKKYRALDEHGKKLVSVVLDMEFERCAKSYDDNTVRIDTYGVGTKEVPAAETAKEELEQPAMIKSFRAASSRDNHEPEVVDMEDLSSIPEYDGDDI